MTDNIVYQQLWKHSNWQDVLVAADTSEGSHYYGNFENPYSAVTPVNGHKYYVKCQTRNRQNIDWTCCFQGNGAYICRLDADGTAEAIVTCTGATYRIFRGYSSNNGSIMTCTYRLHLMDLTEMFGEGNEPTTVAELRQMYPQLDQLSPFEPHRIGSTNA